MENSSEKPWSRPWSTTEMVENANNWNLAADVGLMKHLEQFADNLLSKAEQTNKSLEEQLQQLQNVSLSLDIAKSKFLSLQNTQFIENRVYEDDETVIESTENVKDKKENDFERKDVMKTAVIKGLKILDKYYDKIEVPASDSEDEDTSSNFVLNPKDPYLSRQLPYIIGSEKWHNKWHVGLLESSSESEEDNASDKYSDTESELDLPVSNRLFKNNALDGISDDYSQSAVTTSTARHSDSPVSADNESNSVSYQQPPPTNIFAEELASKLGNVLSGSAPTYPEPEINKRPMQKPPIQSQNIGGFFNDEPPPLNITQDDPHTSDIHGIFSGGTGLFDDEDDTDSLWNPTPIIKTQPKLEKEHKSNIPTDVFQDDNDDKDIFAEANKKPTTQTKKIVGGQAIVPNLFSNEDDLNILLNKKMSIDASVSQQNPIIEKSNTTAAEQNLPKSNVPKLSQEAPKKISLFDDDDDNDIFAENAGLFSNTAPKKFTDIFEDDLFSNATTSNKTIEKDNKPNEDTKSHLLDSEPPPVESKKKKLVVNLFDDDDDSLSDDLFGYVPSFLKPTTKTEPQDQVSTKEKAVKNKEDTFQDKDINNDIPQLLESKEDNVTKVDQPSTSKSSSITNNQQLPNVDVNDFASVIESTVKKVHTDFLSDDIFEEPPPLPSTIKNNTSIDVDYDDWDTKPDDYDIFYEIANPGAKRSIFDNEPPSLSKSSETVPASIEKPIVNTKEKIDSISITKENDHFVNGEKDSSLKETKQEEKLDKPEPIKKEMKSPPGKLKHNLNINVSALLPGVGPPRKKDLNIDTGTNNESIKDNNDYVKDSLFSKEIDTKNANDESTGSIIETSNKNNQISVMKDSSLLKDGNKVEVLQSITKDRAKPLNRRPSTRKGRQQQLRKSGIDFDYDTPKESLERNNSPEPANTKQDVIVKSENIPSEKNQEETKVSAEPNQPKSMIKTVTFEELFGDDPEPIVQPKSQNIEKKTTFEDLFGEDPIEEPKSKMHDNSNSKVEPIKPVGKPVDFDDLFGDDPVQVKEVSKNSEEYKKPIEKKTLPKSFSKSLFEDEDSDNDLFPSTSKLPSTSKVKEAVKVVIPKLSTNETTKKTEKKSLFNDEDSDEDIFSKKKLPTISKNIAKASLFDDSGSSEDDIFGSAPKKVNDRKTTIDSKTTKEANSQKKNVKTSNVKKLDSAIVKDPLNAFRK